MVKTCFFLILICFTNLLSAQGLPNDCVNFVQVCGNYDIHLDVSGAGIQEIGPNVCQSQENNSLWLRFTIKQSGTLGFTLIPESESIQEDYDFWIFGPNVSCDNLGQAIRCSTTNPAAALQPDNHTGLNESSVDFSEGPGPDGDSFLQWLEVAQGEHYFLVIDRPHGNSAFQLSWTGTAVLDNPLLDYNVYSLSPIYICDPENDGVELYDLNYWNSELINNLENIEITYHATESDAVAATNALPNPAPLRHGMHYARITHINSKCFEIVAFMVNMFGYQIESLEIKNNNQIIVHTNINSSESVYYRINGGPWQLSPVFYDVPNGFHELEIKFGDCVSDIKNTYILQPSNVITPNGDALNDVWYFPKLQEIQGVNVVIYDRYGKIVFQSIADKQILWDGTYHGRKLPSGGYWYQISLPDGRELKGHITLID
ncbi:MAG: T9SS type B sorting domain-containing protein [Flavobacteriaceae bacterium]|nr:T9SS type B sorting domain-containing protein [Flavobacteriaceae bacterium]